jgi:hypothetical protein
VGRCVRKTVPMDGASGVLLDRKRNRTPRAGPLQHVPAAGGDGWCPRDRARHAVPLQSTILTAALPPQVFGFAKFLQAEDCD